MDEILEESEVNIRDIAALAEKMAAVADNTPRPVVIAAALSVAILCQRPDLDPDTFYKKIIEFNQMMALGLTNIGPDAPRPN